MSSTSDNGYDSDREPMEGASGGIENEEQMAEDDNNEIPDNINPLLFPDVILGVLKRLPASEVEAFRLVSCTWNKEACKVLKTKRTVVFMEPDAVKVYTNAMKDTTLYPHAQFEICTDLSHENFNDFWANFGAHIKSLDIRVSNLAWSEFLDVVQTKATNLEKLCLRYLPRQDPRGKIDLESKIPIRSVKHLRLASLPVALTGTHGALERLTDLLRLLPNLEVIEFLRIKQVCAQSRVSQALVEVLKKPEVNLLYLKKINVKRLPLQRIEMTLADAVKATSFKDFLMSLRPTLTELKITFPETFSNYQPFIEMNDSMRPDECVQVLTRLKSLNMTNFKGSINFAYRLLELQSLIYTTGNLKDSIPMGFRRRPYGGMTDDHSLQTLKVMSPNCPTDIVTLDGISRCFPYLKSLILHNVDDEGLGVIYRGLPLLSVLKLNASTCTDQGLTGIPLEICTDMVETGIFTVAKVDRYRKDLFLGSLQYLRTFAVSAPLISDASVAFGIVGCKNLKEMKLASPLISDKAIIFLSNRLCKDLDVLDVSKCTNLTEQSTFYAHEKLVGKVIVPESDDGEDQIENITSKRKKTRYLTVTKPGHLDRGIVKTKRGNPSSLSRLSSPDVHFFEEAEPEQFHPFPYPEARRRNIRIRVHNFRRFDNPLRDRRNAD